MAYNFWLHVYPFKINIKRAISEKRSSWPLTACRECTLKRCLFHVYLLLSCGILLDRARASLRRSVLCHVTYDAVGPPPLFPEFTPNRNRLTDSAPQTAIGWRIVRSDGGGECLLAWFSMYIIIYAFRRGFSLIARLILILKGYTWS